MKPNSKPNSNPKNKKPALKNSKRDSDLDSDSVSSVEAGAEFNSVSDLNLSPAPHWSPVAGGQSTPLASPSAGLADGGWGIGLQRWQRIAASIGIGVYLLVLVIGPLSNPIASEHLTGPAAGFVGPVHRALFMGHGYRFFAPNPGDSHLVSYKVTRSDGTQVQGVFPDRKTMWPRLLYHRWFMLSETVFSEHAQTPTPAEFEKLDEQKQQRVKQLAISGKFEPSQQLESQRRYEKEIYAKTMKRIQLLVKAIGGYLLQRFDGQEIELSVVTRTIPFPAEVRQGVRLNDESFLRFPDNAVIGRFVNADFSDVQPTSEEDRE